MATENERRMHLGHRDKRVERHLRRRNDEMKFVHLYTGADGESHLRDVEVETKDAGNRGQRSEPMKVTGIFFSITGADGSDKSTGCKGFVLSVISRGVWLTIDSVINS